MTAEGIPAHGFAGYRILDPLGFGGHGAVFRAHEERWGREVALKTLQAGGDRLQLKREFRMLRELSHPNLVELYELVVDAEEPFFTMELLHARPWPGEARTAPELWNHTRQLFLALQFLHGQGIIHRDLKPNNVMITSEGRLVVLDFGVAARPSDDSGEFAGTFDYAAPEQLFGAAPDALGDVYSAGTMLYEAVAGRLPFEGSPEQQLTTKCSGAPVPPLRPERIPIDAERGQVIEQMLAPQPNDRIGVEEVLARLAPHFAESVSVPLGFGGRSAELASLEELLPAPGGRASLVWLSGSSGIGKSTVLHHFLRHALEGGALVLEGGCSHNETVPFRAMDGVIDELSQWLRRREDLTRGLGLAAATRLFPALDELSWAEPAEAGPREQLRERAETEVVELFARASSDRPLVIAIDDTQWGDSDSAGLLARLVRRAAAAPVLFAFTTRSAASERSLFEKEVARAAREEGVRQREIALAPLPEEQAAKLLATSLGGTPLAGEAVERLASACAGDPYVLNEVARASPAERLELGDELAAGDVDALLRSRVAGLTPGARSLIELCAVAGDSLEIDLAMDLVSEQLAYDEIQELLRRRLLQRTTESTVALYHARIEGALVPGIDVETAKRTHRRLAAALTERKARPGRVATHLWRSGAPDEALPYARAEAELAVRELAFGQATRFYRLALEAPSVSDGERRELEEALGGALRADGQPLEAAAAFRRASELGDEIDRIECRRAAADCLMGAGAIDEGGALLREALREAGYAWPSNRVVAVLEFVLQRTRLRMAGITRRVTRPDASSAPADDLRLDVLWTTAFDTAIADPLPALYFQAIHTREALARGDYRRVSRGRALELVRIASVGRERHREARLEELVREAVEHATTDNDRAFLLLGLGLADLYRGRFSQADATFARSIVAYGDGNIARWELNYARVNRAIVMAQQARLDELEAYAEPLSAELARSRDRLSGAFLDLGALHVLDLRADRPARAQSRIDRALPTARGETLPALDWLRACAQARIFLYQRRPEAVEETMRAARRRHRVLFGFQHIRLLYGWLLAIAARQRGARSDFERAIGRVRREERVVSAGMPLFLDALMANMDGDEARQRVLATDAEAAFRRDGWEGFAAIARHLHGDARSELAALALVNRDAWLRAFGVEP